MKNEPKKKRGCWWIALFVSLPPILLLIFLVFQAFRPSPAIRVSKQTTYLETHLDETGLPDYVAYLHDQIRVDATVDNNAAVLYWKALWPNDLKGNVEHQNLICEALGISVPNPKEAATSRYEATQNELVLWIKENVLPPLADATDKDAESERDEQANEWAEEAIERSQYLPWTAEQAPALAKWVKENQQPLDWLVEGASRPKYYNPSPSMLDPSFNGSVLDILLPGVQMMRDVARKLTCRAMFHLGEGNVEEAWRDLKACHLAARHLTDGCIVEQLVAIAIDSVASKGTQALLHHGNLTEEQASRIYKDLQDLPYLPTMRNALDEEERFLFLDIVKMMSTCNIENSDFLSENGISMKGARIDWNVILERGNQWYDRLAELSELPRTERLIAGKQLDAELQELFPKVSTMALSLISQKARTELLSDTLINLLTPAVNAAAEATDRMRTTHDLNRLVAALALFRAKHGNYPQKLEDLVPEIIAKLPTDLYSGKSFVYKKTEKGFYVYSLYRNGIDDGGRDFTGEIDGGKWASPKLLNDLNSDLVILMPLPDFKISAPEE